MWTCEGVCNSFKWKKKVKIKKSFMCFLQPIRMNLLLWVWKFFQKTGNKELAWKLTTYDSPKKCLTLDVNTDLRLSVHFSSVQFSDHPEPGIRVSPDSQFGIWFGVWKQQQEAGRGISSETRWGAAQRGLQLFSEPLLSPWMLNPRSVQRYSHNDFTEGCQSFSELPQSVGSQRAGVILWFIRLTKERLRSVLLSLHSICLHSTHLECTTFITWHV